MVTGATAPGKKSLQTTLEISRAVKAYYGGVQAAKQEGKPIVWSYGLIPREIFHAVGAPVIYLEHLPLLMSTKQLSGRYCQIAEEEGFSRDVCAFHRCFIGCAAEEEKHPYLAKFWAPPDLIIASNLPCMSESKSFLYAANHFNCPYFFIDAPINIWGKEIPDYAVEYYAGQLGEALDFLGGYGYRLDWAKLKEAVALSRRLVYLWREIDEYRKAIPAPMGIVDGLTCAFPLIQLPGTKLGVELYERLRDEIKERVENKIGVLEEEKLRLLWIGVPPFYNMGLLNYPEQYGAIVVKSFVEYLAGGAFDPAIMDPEKPLESLATKALVDIVNPTYQNMIDFAVQTAKDFSVDGQIALVKRSCGLIPGVLRLVKDAVYQADGIPTTIFDLDGMDLREYDDAATKANIDSFIETLLDSKRRG